MLDFPSVTPGIFSARVLRRVPVIFLPVALLISAAVSALYFLDRSNEHTLHEQAGDYQTDLHIDIIHREVKFVESDLVYLANQAILLDFLAGRAGSKKELQDEYVLFCRYRVVYDQIRYLDALGHERVRVNANFGQPVAVPERELQSKADRYYFSEALRLNRGQVFCSPFDLNIEHDQIERPLKPVIRFATPVFDRNGSKRGILILNYPGGALLGKMADVTAGFAGSVWLLNREGGLPPRPDPPEEEWGFMLGHDHSFSTAYPEEWRILDGAAKPAIPHPTRAVHLPHPVAARQQPGNNQFAGGRPQPSRRARRPSQPLAEASAPAGGGPWFSFSS